MWDAVKKATLMYCSTPTQQTLPARRLFAVKKDGTRTEIAFFDACAANRDILFLAQRDAAILGADLPRNSPQYDAMYDTIVAHYARLLENTTLPLSLPRYTAVLSFVDDYQSYVIESV